MLFVASSTQAQQTVYVVRHAEQMKEVEGPKLEEEGEMRSLDELDRRAHRMGIVDVKLSAVSALFAGFVVAKLFPRVLSLHVWLYILFFVAFAVHPLIVLFYRNGPSDVPAN